MEAPGPARGAGQKRRQVHSHVTNRKRGGSRVTTWELFLHLQLATESDRGCKYKMPGKKKKGKAKGGKKGGDGKLPPPPNLDDTRQGALEALLSFKYI